METIKQHSIETVAGGQRTRMSNQRMIFIGAMCLTVFYVVWGIAKVIS